jgi:hypothetical protein
MAWTKWAYIDVMKGDDNDGISIGEHENTSTALRLEAAGREEEHLR